MLAPYIISQIELHSSVIKSYRLFDIITVSICMHSIANFWYLWSIKYILLFCDAINVFHVLTINEYLIFMLNSFRNLGQFGCINLIVRN